MKFMNSYQKLCNLNKEFEKTKDTKFEVIRNNHWLQNYFGHTYTQKLHQELSRGLFEEHGKKADAGCGGIEKALVFCMDRNTMEIKSVAGSSLLREVKSDKIYENLLQHLLIKKRKVIGDLILNNFGLLFASLFGSGATTASVIDDSNSAFSLRAMNGNSSAGTCLWNINGGAGAPETRIQMGSGTSAPARSDYKIQTALGSAPESGLITTNIGGWTVSSTVIYQADANPTGGSGTVNEIITSGHWTEKDTPVLKNFTIAHDVLNFGLPSAVGYTAGHLLRGAFTWQL